MFNNFSFSQLSRFVVVLKYTIPMQLIWKPFINHLYLHSLIYFLFSEQDWESLFFFCESPSSEFLVPSLYSTSLLEDKCKNVSASSGVLVDFLCTFSYPDPVFVFLHALFTIYLFTFYFIALGTKLLIVWDRDHFHLKVL